MQREPSDSSRTLTDGSVFPSIPTDASALLFVAAVSDLAVFVLPPGSLLRIALGLPLLCFVPGYALLGVWFPAAATTPSRDWSDAPAVSAAGQRGRTGLATPERLALSVGVSVALIPLLGLALSLSPIDAGPVPIAGCLTAVVLLGVWGRTRTADATRYRSPVDSIRQTVRQSLFAPRRTRVRLANGFVLLTVLVSAVTMVGAFVASPQGDSYTSLSVLTENESGVLVAGDYPRTLAEGAEPVSVRIANHEGKPETYTLVTTLQRIRVTNGSASIAASRRLDRRQVSVPENESRTVRQALDSPLRGGNRRVVVRLFRGDAPSNPAPGTAYRRVFFWLNGTADGRAAITRTDGSG